MAKKSESLTASAQVLDCHLNMLFSSFFKDLSSWASGHQVSRSKHRVGVVSREYANLSAIDSS